MLSDASYDENNPELLRYHDQLIEIDGVNVESVLREEVVNRIKSADHTVRLLVKTVVPPDLPKSPSSTATNAAARPAAAEKLKRFDPVYVVSGVCHNNAYQLD